MYFLNKLSAWKLLGAWLLAINFFKLINIDFLFRDTILAVIAVAAGYLLMERGAPHPHEDLPPDVAKVIPLLVPSKDDLKRIDGIDKKISKALRQAGIKTYASLAETEVNKLKQILSDAGVKSAHVSTWPEQARLLAADRQNDS